MVHVEWCNYLWHPVCSNTANFAYSLSCSSASCVVWGLAAVGLMERGNVQALKKDSGNLKKQKERMEMLCRTLTQERSDLKDKLRALGALPGPDLTPGLAAPDAEANGAAQPQATPEPDAAAAGAE
jgi:hypothetical protein